MNLFPIWSEVENQAVIVFKNSLHGWSEWCQQVEAADDDESKEDSIVVEDGESGSFIISNLIFLPQDPRFKKWKVKR